MNVRQRRAGVRGSRVEFSQDRKEKCMRAKLRRWGMFLCCASLFQLVGCDVGDLSQQVQETISANARATIVEIGTLFVEAAVDSVL